MYNYYTHVNNNNSNNYFLIMQCVITKISYLTKAVKHKIFY